jgi:4-hydroxyphenylpyruvate dioxygenase
VTLYKRGGINFVLNADRDSFAHSYYLLHGVSICATALGVEDPAQALSRADAFGCHRFEGRVGPNERHIPAVRAPDGTLIYFTEGDFDFSSDFTLTPISPRPKGLKAIDHVAQAVPPEQFDTWLLFYRTVLGLQPEDIWILPDPYGLVRSRAFASANKTIRFPLNFSESRNTATARSVQTFSGAGVHHIALSTEDIFATVAELRAAGLALLPIPGNYYEDLPTRFEMDDALLNRLQQHGILYDRTPDGEFFHVYTQLFEDRFFFEIVQRNGNYQAYGAVNAPVRMAALAQMREGTSDVLAENL